MTAVLEPADVEPADRAELEPQVVCTFCGASTASRLRCAFCAETPTALVVVEVLEVVELDDAPVVYPKLLVLLAVAAMLGWHGRDPFTAATAMFGVSSLALLAILVLAAREQDWTNRPVPAGRVVAIVPAFNETTEALHRAIASLVGQVDRVVVVDDGSDVALEPYPHPDVAWLRTPNQGKRRAQITGLQWSGELGAADFVVTVDSDSVVGPDAVERLLQAFDDPRTQAATGLQVVANRTRNLITRVTDVEMIYGELTIRRARSAIGAVCPCGGALSAYRADVIRDNVDDYLTSGTFSDDRRLAHYALQRGRVVSVHAAVVETLMPETPAAAFRQRTRWFKGAWKYAPWELRNLEGAPLYLRAWNFLGWIVYPLVMAWSLLVSPLLGGPVHLAPFAYWLTLLYVQAAVYVFGRPGVGLLERVLSWALLTPLLSAWQILVVRPAMYWALTQTRSTSWQTRGAGAAPVPAARLEAVSA